MTTYLITFPNTAVHLTAATPTDLTQQVLHRIKAHVPGVLDVLIPLDDDMQPGRIGWVEAPNGVPLGRFGIRRVGR
jgi:hypothetical protein